MRVFLPLGLVLTGALSAPFLIVPASQAAAPAPARWAVNKAASKIGFRSSFGGETFAGHFARWDATIAFDPKNLAGSKVVATIETASARTGESSRDSALPTADWFASAKFPRASFVSKSFKSLGNGRYQASGDLTIRGVRRPVVLPFTLAITGNQARMSGSLKLNRTLFGVGQGQWASGDTVPTIVAVNITVVASRKPG